jgi:hypothetical protein
VGHGGGARRRAGCRGLRAPAASSLLAHHPSLSIAVPATPPDDAPDAKKLDERRHTDSVSVNFNALFVDDAGEAVAFVSERTGAASLFLSRAGFFVSAHEKPEGGPFWSWAAVYAAGLGGEGDVSASGTSSPSRCTGTGPGCSTTGPGDGGTGRVADLARGAHTRVFLPTPRFLPPPSGMAVYRGIPLDTARIQISNQNPLLPLVQTVLNGIARYK